MQSFMPLAVERTVLAVGSQIYEAFHAQEKMLPKSHLATYTRLELAPPFNRRWEVPDVTACEGRHGNRVLYLAVFGLAPAAALMALPWPPPQTRISTGAHAPMVTMSVTCPGHRLHHDGQLAS